MSELELWFFAAIIIFGLPAPISIIVANFTSPTRYHKWAFFGWMASMLGYAIALTYRLGYYLAGGWEGVLWVTALLAPIAAALYLIRSKPNQSTPQENAAAQAAFLIFSMGEAVLALLLFLRIILHWVFTTPLI